MKKRLPSASVLQAHLRYVRSTGQLWWKIPGRGRVRTREVGSISVHGYRVLSFCNVTYKAHRVIWKLVTGCEPRAEIDHRDCVRSNNRWKNLREAAPAQNFYNRRREKTTISGLKGVSWHRLGNGWRARITYRNNKIYLGTFPTSKQAHAAYVAAAKQHFRSFARAA